MLLCVLSAFAAPLFAQRTGPSPVLATPPAAAQGLNGHLDPEAATQAYLATLPTDKKASKGFAIATRAFVFFGTVIGPVVITPMFNTPTKLADARVVDPILRLARQSGINATDVWELDASKESKRISANVSGVLAAWRWS